MVFNTTVFLFLFLPCFLAVYFLAGKSWRNPLLLAGSFVFYAWGEPVFIWTVLASSLVDWLVGREITKPGGGSKFWLTVGVAQNLAILALFKYFNFFTGQFLELLARFGISASPFLTIALPIGVSFIVFEKITYLVDLHRKVGTPCGRFDHYLLYVLFFPKLMAGPIIKYHEMEGQIRERPAGWDDLAAGLSRFITGLAKKVLIADTVAQIADTVFGVSAPSTGLAWLGVAAFAIQIYFDFSGYSDMALGLARMFGFQLRENFNHPYTSLNFTEFWRRWHISLSTWIRDYLYFPLGGGRASPGRVYFNLWICFLASGIWHGANWNFLAWGVFHGCVLVVEKAWWLERQRGLPVWMNNAVTMVLILASWVVFRSQTLGESAAYLKAMFTPVTALTPSEFPAESFLALAVGGAMALCPEGIWARAKASRASAALKAKGLDLAFSLLLLAFACSKLANENFESFLYFRF